MSNELSKIAAKSLGDSTSYAVYTDKYDASLLNFMPRSLAREDWGIDGNTMAGYDVWHCYEATFLLDSGQPVAGTLKIVFPVSNTHVVESKSMKLYLNSFDMCKMGATFKEAIAAYENRVKADLAAGGLSAEIRFFSAHVLEATFFRNNVHPHPLRMFTLLDVDEKHQFDDYTANKKHITTRAPSDSRHMLYTNVLRSRCRHTKQKDTGSAFFILHGQVSRTELLEEVVALREVNEFHEFCAEKLYSTLSQSFDKVGVALIYSRRGSLDIHPIRYSSDPTKSVVARSIFEPLISTRNFVQQVFGQ